MLNRLQQIATKKALYLILAIALCFAISYSLLSVLRHIQFQSGAFDLGIFDQAVYQYANFQYPYNTVKEKLIIADHLTLTLPLLAPLYWLSSDVKILLIFQAFFLAFSSVGIYLYLVTRKFTNIQSLLLAVLYLSFYGIQFAVFFDFHPVILGVGVLPWILYTWEKEKWTLFAVLTALLLLTQENMGIALTSLAIFWIFERKKLKLAFGMLALGVIATVLSFVAIQHISAGNLQYTPDIPQSINDAATRLWDHQDKQNTWLYTFSWYSFVPVLSPPAVFAVLLDLSQYFIAGTDFVHMWTPFFHHRAILSVYLLIGTANVLILLKARKPSWITPIICLMLLSAAFQQFYFHFALNKLTKQEYWQHPSWVQDNNDIIGQVPENTPIAAQQSLVPHLSQRDEIYLLYPRQKDLKNESICPEKSCWWLESAGEPEYIVVDTHPGVWVTMTLEQEENFKKALENMQELGAIDVYKEINDAKIFKVNTHIYQTVQ